MSSAVPPPATGVPAARVRLRRVLLFAAIVGLQFGLFEAGLRLWSTSEADPGFQKLFTADRTIGYRLAPGARTRFTTAEFDTDLAISADGVREDGPLGPKAPDERRIAVLGDSLVLAVQVPLRETFCKRLEAQLDARGDGLRYRVIDAGVQGYGPVEEALFYERVVRRLQPDVVLQVIYVGNDAEEAARTAFRLEDGGTPNLQTVRVSVRERVRRVVRRSMVLQILRLRLMAVRDRLRHAAPPEPPLQSYAASPDPRIGRGLEVARDAVERLARDVQRDGGRFAIALMPARFQVDAADYGRLRALVSEAGGELVRDAATARFRDALAPTGVPIVDLLPIMRAAPAGPDLFFQQTAHLTPRGHAVVAHGLEAFLRERGLVPDRRQR